MNQKRHTLKKVVRIGALALILPSSWTKPVVSSLILPAHAQTSTTLRLNDIADIQIVGQNDDSDPRVTFLLIIGLNFGRFRFTFDLFDGPDVNENTVFTLVNNPTVGGRIGTLSIDDRKLVWSIDLSTAGPGTELDEFPRGEYSITAKAENPDGSQASTTFKIIFM